MVKLTNHIALRVAKAHLATPGFIQASMGKIQGLLKASPTVFKDLKLMKKLIEVLKFFLRNEIMETLVMEN